jgi:MSHA biogenesis protein MshJ
MKKRLHQVGITLAERINDRSTRERVLLLVTVLTAVFFGSSEAALGPLHDAQNQMNTRISLKQKQVAATQEAIQKLVSEQRLDPEDPARQRLVELKKSLNDTQAPMIRLLSGLVNPREMVELVQKFLAANNKVEVLQLKNVPPVALSDDDSSISTTATEDPDNGFHLYKHGLQIRLSGSYRELVRCIASFEELPWKVLWNDIRLNVDDQGRPVVDIQVYTLSRSKAWIGV